ncbi:uncharacterized protein ABDE67_016364 [Symphorus nematophorus]
MSSDIPAAPDVNLNVRCIRESQENRGEEEEYQVEILQDEEHHVDLESQKANVFLNLEKDQLQNSYDKLSSNYTQLQGQNSDVAINNSQLQSCYETLSKNYKQMEDEINQLKGKNEGMEINNSQLQSGYETLSKKYKQLEDEINQLKGKIEDILAAQNLNLNVRMCTREIRESRGERQQNQVEEDEEHHAGLGSQKDRLRTPKNPAAVKRRHFTATAVTLSVMYLLILAGVFIRYMAVNGSQLQTSYETKSKIHIQLREEVKQLKAKIEGKWCPEGWKRFGCSCYFKSTEKKTWSQSRSDCQNNGADLVIINTKEEQKFLIELNMDGESWIGLWEKWTASGWVWEWVDRSPLTEMFWASGLPKHSLRKDGAACCNQQGQWTNSEYYDIKNWICEK